jgi:two-component system, chemotaxis family, chemotaxis protein CheY
MAKTVMIVDDSRTIREVVVKLLSTAGYGVAAAVDGRDGLQQMRSLPELALVLCDINMPQMGGIELLTALAQEPLPTPVPILMLTSEVAPGMLERARAAGAKGWLVKPFKPDVLIAAVRKMAGAA